MRAPTAMSERLRVKAVVCKIEPLFRGSSCGLRGNPRSRNDCPILLARAKPGRGGQYGTGWPGGAYRPGRCLSLGCTPRSPRESGGRSPRRVLGTPHRAKSPPPEADKPTSPVCFRRPNRGRDSTVGARIARPLGCDFCAPASMRPACGGCGPMWASAPTPCRATHPHRRGGYQPPAWLRCLSASGHRPLRHQATVSTVGVRSAGGGQNREK